MPPAVPVLKEDETGKINAMFSEKITQETRQGAEKQLPLALQSIKEIGNKLYTRHDVASRDNKVVATGVGKRLVQMSEVATCFMTLELASTLTRDSL